MQDTNVAGIGQDGLEKSAGASKRYEDPAGLESGWRSRAKLEDDPYAHEFGQPRGSGNSFGSRSGGRMTGTASDELDSATHEFPESASPRSPPSEDGTEENMVQGGPPHIRDAGQTGSEGDLADGYARLRAQGAGNSHLSEERDSSQEMGFGAQAESGFAGTSERTGTQLSDVTQGAVAGDQEEGPGTVEVENTASSQEATTENVPAEESPAISAEDPAGQNEIPFRPESTGQAASSGAAAEDEAEPLAINDEKLVGHGSLTGWTASKGQAAAPDLNEEEEVLSSQLHTPSNQVEAEHAVAGDQEGSADTKIQEENPPASPAGLPSNKVWRTAQAEVETDAAAADEKEVLPPVVEEGEPGPGDVIAGHVKPRGETARAEDHEEAPSTVAEEDKPAGQPEPSTHEQNAAENQEEAPLTMPEAEEPAGRPDEGAGRSKSFGQTARTEHTAARDETEAPPIAAEEEDRSASQPYMRPDHVKSTGKTIRTKYAAVDQEESAPNTVMGEGARAGQPRPKHVAASSSEEAQATTAEEEDRSEEESPPSTAMGEGWRAAEPETEHVAAADEAEAPPNMAQEEDRPADQPDVQPARGKSLGHTTKSEHTAADQEESPPTTAVGEGGRTVQPETKHMAAADEEEAPPNVAQEEDRPADQPNVQPARGKSLGHAAKSEHTADDQEESPPTTAVGEGGRAAQTETKHMAAADEEEAPPNMAQEEDRPADQPGVQPANGKSLGHTAKSEHTADDQEESPPTTAVGEGGRAAQTETKHMAAADEEEAPPNVAQEEDRPADQPDVQPARGKSLSHTTKSEHTADDQEESPPTTAVGEGGRTAQPETKHMAAADEEEAPPNAAQEEDRPAGQSAVRPGHMKSIGQSTKTEHTAAASEDEPSPTIAEEDGAPGGPADLPRGHTKLGGHTARTKHASPGDQEEALRTMAEEEGRPNTESEANEPSLQVKSAGQTAKAQHQDETAATVEPSREEAYTVVNQTDAETSHPRGKSSNGLLDTAGSMPGPGNASISNSGSGAVDENSTASGAEASAARPSPTDPEKPKQEDSSRASSVSIQSTAADTTLESTSSIAANVSAQPAPSQYQSKTKEGVGQSSQEVSRPTLLRGKKRSRDADNSTLPMQSVEASEPRQPRPMLSTTGRTYPSKTWASGSGAEMARASESQSTAQATESYPALRKNAVHEELDEGRLPRLSSEVETAVQS